MRPLIALIVLAMLAGCGGETGPDALGTTIATTPTTSVAAAAPTSGATTSPPLTAAPTTTAALSAGADLPDIVAALDAVLGPTDDIAAELSPFVTLPDGIATPKGTSIEYFDSTLSAASTDDAAPLPARYRLDLIVQTDASPDDVGVFFETTMADAGYALLSATDDEKQEISVRELEYEIPDRGPTTQLSVKIYDVAEPPQTVMQIKPADDWIELTVSDTLPAGAFDALEAWPQVPGVAPERLEVMTVGLQARTREAWQEPITFPDQIRQIGNTYRLRDAGSAADVTRRMRATIPNDLYRFSDGAPRSGPISLSRDGIGDDGVQLFANADVTTGDVTVAASFVDRFGTAIITEEDPPATTSVESTVPATSTTDGSPMEGMTSDAIVDAVNEALGPSDDLVATLAPFVDIRDPIPTPAGTEVFSLSAEVAVDFEGRWYQRASAQFETDATAADLISFFSAEMVSAGYRPTGTGDEENTRILTYEIPGASVPYNEIEIQVIDGRTRDYAQFRVSAPAEPGAIGPLDAWPGQLPGLGPASPTLAEVTAYEVDSEHFVTLSVGLDSIGVSERTLRRSIRNALPSEVYELVGPIDFDPDGLELRREGFDEILVTFDELLLLDEEQQPEVSVSIRATIQLD